MTDANVQVFMAAIIIWLVIVWSYVWKLIACWKAARRDQLWWYIVFALPIPFGFFEILYVFWVSPRIPEVGQGPY